MFFGLREPEISKPIHGEVKNMATISLDSGELNVRLRGLLGEERGIQVEFLLHLSRFEELRGHEVLGYAKLWDYLRRELALLEATAWRRLRAMTLLRRFPDAEPRLRDGRLSLTSFVMLRHVLTEANSEELFGLIVGKSTREIEVIAASLNEPVQPPKRLGVVRKLPHRRAPVEAIPPAVEPVASLTPKEDSAAAPIAPLAPTVAASTGETVPKVAIVDLRENPIADRTGGDAERFAILPVGVVRPRREVVLPIARDQFSIKLFVPAEFVAKLEAAKRILGAKVPGGEIERVLSEGLDRILRDDARRFRPRAGRRAKKQAVDRGGTGERGRVAIPIALERLVRARDGHRCCWPLANGEVCGSVHRLEIDHILAVALGGRTTLANLRLACRDHNQMHARADFGEEFMARFVR